MSKIMKVVFVAFATLLVLNSVFAANSCDGLQEGASFLAEDGCNTCTCHEGAAQCTESICSNSGDIICPQNSHVVFGTPLINKCSAAESEAIPEVAVGCLSDSVRCIMMEQTVISPNGELFVIQGCIPEGFTAVQADCANIKGCVAGTRPVLAVPKDDFCLESFDAETVSQTVAGCVEKNAMCIMQTTFATKNGLTYAFHDACIPEGFERVEDSCPSTGSVQCLSNQREVKAFTASSFCSKGAESIANTVGCVDSMIMCLGVVSFAADQNGNVYLFTDSCLPEGFTTVETTCKQIMEASSCTANQHAVTAIPKANYCSNSESKVSIAVGCVENNLMCTEQVVFAKNQEGNIYVFNSGCIPEGFTLSEDGCDPICPLGSRPVFATPSTNTCWNTDSSFHISQVVGCVDASSACLMVQTLARERGTGEFMTFSDTCIPTNFEIVPEVRTCDDLLCLPLSCGSQERTCVVRQAECTSTLCIPNAFCSAPECIGHGINEEFNVECNSCTCDASGSLFCTKKKCPPPQGPVQCTANQRQISATEAIGHCFGAAPNQVVTQSVVGCVESNAMCLMMTGFARRLSDGTVFYFSDACIPEGFRLLPNVQTCDELVCEDSLCPNNGQVCIANHVECFTTPCVSEPVCADKGCAGHFVGEYFNNVNGECTCDYNGIMTCSTSEDTSNNTEKSSSAMIYTIGGAGAAVASLALAFGYRKYKRSHQSPLISSEPSYRTFNGVDV